MIGKKNIVFGFLYLVLTAGLGPLMVTQLGTADTAIGPILILIGLLFAGLASAFGFRGELIRDVQGGESPR